ncbi:MAG: hypothetical protein HY705_08880 [Gemmatimonadetes bacterium]|nr:hypothetical protein [Gemmatimonadota bacterium]
MSPGTEPRDWDKELAKIDRLMGAGAGAGRGAPAPPAPGTAGGGVAPARDGRAALYTWVRLILGLALGAAMTQWPYVHGCGLPLFGYLAAVAAVLAAASWSAVSSWRTRSGLAHTLALVLFCWALVLAAREVLPRIGYAREESAWLCAPPAGSAARPAPQPSAQLQDTL